MNDKIKISDDYSPEEKAKIRAKAEFFRSLSSKAKGIYLLELATDTLKHYTFEHGLDCKAVYLLINIMKKDVEENIRLQYSPEKAQEIYDFINQLIKKENKDNQ